MVEENSIFLNVLSKNITDISPLYCTGYPEFEFIRNYVNAYGIKSEKDYNLILKDKDYSIIKNMGFDAISIWDFRRGIGGGYKLKNNKHVDSWGRIYKENWYQNDGVFKHDKILETWEHLTLPSKNDIELLKNFSKKIKPKLDPVLSLPGLFEKTWQSMGFVFFSKCLKFNNIELIKKIIQFFSDYLKKLINTLQDAGIGIFLVADDCGYKNRSFIPKDIWSLFFFKRYKEIIDIVHKKNQKIIIHSDGYISNLIDVFIDLGFDGVQSLEPSAGVDIFSLFKKYTNQICFIGNIDVSELIFGTPDQVKNYLKELIKKARKYNSLLIVSPTQQINAKVKPENIKAMIDTTKLL